MHAFFDLSALPGHGPTRCTRAYDWHDDALQQRLEAFSEPAMQPGGAPARAPRTQRRTPAKKPATGSDDGDGEPAPARRRVAPLFWTIEDVCDATTLGVTSVRKMIREGSFPKPREIGPRRVAWLASEVMTWAQACPSAEMLPPPSAQAL
ncbi:helix-turn-helix transcriptional regulator [Paraburkholderia sp. A1RO-5L]|uniref:helix-turn-helix transcriptional regulator n=1 Tax=Paraburkholderia sp. A1RO-5L TaxID=3028370 RepID=UPI003B980D2A